jgi:2-methylcitrate dehydratase PrpD
VSGAEFAAAALIGYEVGAKIGRGLVTGDFARRFRPTGFTGPLAAAAASAALLGLDAAETASALALAANTAAGLNEWPRTGGSEMFFQPGYAARDGVTAAALAAAGAYGSDGALDGEAGLFSAFGRSAAAAEIRLFDGDTAEIMTVYHKPLPVCNFAQTPCQAALALVREGPLRSETIRGIRVLASRAAITYPGCDSVGPFERTLQKKMSIPFGVASALLAGRLTEDAFAASGDPRVPRLAEAVTLQELPEFTEAFPARQGAEVVVELTDGSTRSARLVDVIAASAEQVRSRFAAVAAAALGARQATAIAARIENIETARNAGELMSLVAAAHVEA